MPEFLNMEIERKVLKCLFWNKDLFLKSSSRGQLPEKVFSDTSFRIILKWMKQHFAKTGECLTLDLLYGKIERLKIKGKKEKDAEVYRDKLTSIADKFLAKKPLKRDLRNFRTYLDELILLMKANDMQRFNMNLFKALDSSQLEEAEQLVSSYKLPTYGDDVDQSDITANFQEREHYVMERKNNPDKYRLIPTGIKELDKALGGGIGREFGCFSGSSNAGKSFALQHIAAHCRKIGLNVVLFTIEMQLLETQFRLDCNIAGIDFSFFRNPAETYKKGVHKKWKRKIDNLAKKAGKLEVVAFKKNAKMSFIESKLYEIMNQWQEPIDICLIDYLDDIEPDNDKVGYKDWASFGDISWNMHRIAKNFAQIDNTEGLPLWTAMQMKKSSKDITVDKKGLGEEAKGKKRAPDERDVGSSPLPFRHSDIWIGIQTVVENKASLLHIMKGRFTDKARDPIACFHAFARGRFHSIIAMEKFAEDHKDEIQEKEAITEDYEIDAEKEGNEDEGKD